MEGRCEDGLKIQVSSSLGQFVHQGIFLPSSHQGLSFLAGVSKIHSKIRNSAGVRNDLRASSSFPPSAATFISPGIWDPVLLEG